MPHSEQAVRAVSYLREHCPYVPVIARAWDLEASARLLSAGATRAYPEAVEASLRLAGTALAVLNVPAEDIDDLIEDVRNWDYEPVREDPKG